MAAKRGRAVGLPKAQPWMPAEYEIADVAAMQAVAYGRASEEQQKRAYAYIVHVLCGTYDVSFRPGDSSRETDFAEGKRFVGIQCAKLADPKLLELLRKTPKEQGATPET